MKRKVDKTYLAKTVKYYRENGENMTAARFVEKYLESTGCSPTELEEEIARIRDKSIKKIKPKKNG